MKRFGIEGLLLVLTLAAYSNSFRSGFVLDNKALILLDPRVHAATAQNLDGILERTYWWPVGESGLYRPFTKLTYLLDYAVLGHGENPAGYHVFNLLLHFLNAVLLYRLGRRLMEDARAAAVLAALWAVHPVLTESVTNIVGRADLLAGATILGGLLLYLCGMESGGARRWMWWGALLLTSLAGMFSKESAVVLPGVALAYELTFHREERRWRAAAPGFAAMLLPLLLLVAQRASVLAAAGHSDFPYLDNPLVAADFWTGKLTAVAVVARSLALIVWPTKLSSDYAYHQIPLAQGTWLDWLSWTAAAALAVGALLSYRRSRAAFFLACFALMTYLPSSNLLFPIGATMAERFLYLPAIGAIGCLVLAVRTRRWMPVAAGVVIVCLGVRTWIRNEDWRNDLSMAQANVLAAPDSYKSHEGLAFALHQAGRLDAAIAEYDKSLKILSGVPDALSNGEPYMIAGGYLLEKGDYVQARDVLKRGDTVVQATSRAQNVSAPTRFALLYRLLAAAHLRLNEYDASLRHALYARELAPTEAETYKQLAESYWGLRDGERAAITLLEGIILAPDVSLRDAAVEFYTGSGIDKEGCAVRERVLNPQCGLVHRHMCAAAADAIRLRERGGDKASAANISQMALTRMGCDAGFLKPPR